jgi:hypothetical protein
MHQSNEMGWSPVVMLSATKQIAPHFVRSFAALRMTMVGITPLFMLQ